MAFVNEYIPEEDVKKYEIVKWDEKFLKGHYQPSWTVDRERNIYLRYMSSGREEFSNRHTFMFFGNGYVLSAELATTGSGKRGGTQWRNYELMRLMVPLFDPIPEALESRRQEIMADLKEALIAFKDFGVRSNSTTHSATFNF